jgi:hypothetical protein
MIRVNRKCLCGCGGKVKLKNKYIIGHYAKDTINRKTFHHSEETKQKIRERHIGTVISEEVKLKMSIAHKRNPISFWKGKHHSEETKLKIKTTVNKTYQNPEVRKKCARPNQIISEEHKNKVKQYMLNAWNNSNFRNNLIGEKANNWQGGKSFEPYSIKFNNCLKKYIRKRDNNTCQNPNCSKITKIINIHHIDYNKLNCNEKNLITVCTSCNSKANFNRKNWIIFYQDIINKKYNATY